MDAGGNAYVVGVTWSNDFPTTVGAVQLVFGGTVDAFVTKLNPTGTGLVYSTYLGGSGQDAGSGIAVDADGNAYVTGTTDSTNFPTTVGAFRTAFDGGRRAFVTKLTTGGSAFVYSTYLGAGTGFSIAVDNLGRAYVTGEAGINFPTTAGAFQTKFGGGRISPGDNFGFQKDAFMTELDSTGSTLVYSTFLGGSDQDTGFGIAVDAGGNAYVTGSTASTNFPTTPGAFQTSFRGGSDVFIAKFAATNTTRSEEDATSQIGAWTSFGSESGTFSGGTIVAANTVASTAMFRFTGTAVSWIGVKCNVCGVAAVSIDGGAPTMVNTAGPGVPGSLTSEVVFSASGLDPAVTHTMVITATGTTKSNNAYIAVDAFDVTAGNATSPLLPSVVLPPPPPVVPPLPSPF